MNIISITVEILLHKQNCIHSFVNTQIFAIFCIHWMKCIQCIQCIHISYHAMTLMLLTFVVGYKLHTHTATHTHRHTHTRTENKFG